MVAGGRGERNNRHTNTHMDNIYTNDGKRWIFLELSECELCNKSVAIVVCAAHTQWNMVD